MLDNNYKVVKQCNVCNTIYDNGNKCPNCGSKNNEIIRQVMTK